MYGYYILYTKSYQHIYKDTKGLALHGLQDMIVKVMAATNDITNFC
jgi:hypothetical protein